MKKYIIYLILLVVALLTSFACSTRLPFDDGNNNSSSGSNNLGTGQIEIKVYPDPDEKNRVSFDAITNKITIDWGDGNIDKLTPNGASQEFIHTYANQNLQTISIESEKLVGFGGQDGIFKEMYLGEMNNLERLNIRSKLTVLEIKKAKSLTSLICDGNQLTSLDVSGLTALELLYCTSNQLTSLDLSGLNALIALDCSLNRLTSLNLSDLNALRTLDCSWNQLTSLDIRGLKNIKGINCSFNKFNINTVNLLLENLPTLPSSAPPDWYDSFRNYYWYYFFRDNFGYVAFGSIRITAYPGGIDGINKTIATNKGWSVNP